MEEGALPARNRVVDLLNNDNHVEGGPVAATTYLSRELFEAVASHNHEALLHAYATHARASLLRYAAAKSRWSSWIPHQHQQQNQSPSARLRRRQQQHQQQQQGELYGREKFSRDCSMLRTKAPPVGRWLFAAHPNSSIVHKQESRYASR
jgi:hypothetical protein